MSCKKESVFTRIFIQTYKEENCEYYNLYKENSQAEEIKNITKELFSVNYYYFSC